MNNVLFNELGIVEYKLKECMGLGVTGRKLVVIADVHIEYAYYGTGNISGRINEWVFSWPQSEILPYIIKGASCAGGSRQEKELLASRVNEYRNHIHEAIEMEEKRLLLEKNNKVIMLYEDEVSVDIAW